MSEKTQKHSWQDRYRQLDDSALLAMLPVLERHRDKMREELEHVSAGEESWRKQYEGLLNKVEQLKSATPDRGVDEREFKEGVRELEAKVDRLKPSDELSPHHRGVFEHLVDLQERINWINNIELVRRELIPDLALALDAAATGTQ